MQGTVLMKCYKLWNSTSSEVHQTLALFWDGRHFSLSEVSKVCFPGRLYIFLSFSTDSFMKQVSTLSLYGHLS